MSLLTVSDLRTHFRTPTGLLRAVDGVSLTVVDPEPGAFGAAVIPETLRRTNLGTANIGSAVNLEFDMIAKYVHRLVTPYLPK